MLDGSATLPGGHVAGDPGAGAHPGAGAPQADTARRAAGPGNYLSEVPGQATGSALRHGAGTGRRPWSIRARRTHPVASRELGTVNEPSWIKPPSVSFSRLATG